MKQFATTILLSLVTGISHAQLSIDQTFAVNGCTTNASSNTTASITLQPDGKIIVPLSNSSIYSRVYRYKANGTPDSSFGTNGLASTPDLMFAFDSVKPGIWSHTIGNNSAVVQPDGKIVTCGSYEFCGQVLCGSIMPLLVRYNANGTLDNTFGSNGMLLPMHNLVGNSMYYAYFSKMRSAGAGKLYVCGYEGYKTFVARLNADGSYDNTYGTGGFCYLPKSGLQSPDTGYQSFTDFTVDASGNVYGLGQYYVGYGQGPGTLRGSYVIKIKPNGVIDASYGVRGVRPLTFSYASWPGALGLRKDNKLVVSGNVYDSTWAMQSSCWVTLLDANGSIAASMMPGGFIRLDKDTYNEGAAIVPDGPDGAIMAMTTHHNNSADVATYAVRLGADGKVDVASASQGMLPLTVANANIVNTASMISVPGNKILLGGSMKLANGNTPLMLMQLKGATPTGVQPIRSTTEGTVFSLYPNPMTDAGHCTITLTESAHVGLAIYSLDGRLISTLLQDKELPAGSTVLPLDIKSTLAPGMYYLLLQTNKGEQRTQKFVVE